MMRVRATDPRPCPKCGKIYRSAHTLRTHMEDKHTVSYATTTPLLGSPHYRASHVLGDLGWVDLDLGSSPGWWSATVATYCQSRVVEHSKSKSTKPSL